MPKERNVEMRIRTAVPPLSKHSSTKKKKRPTQASDKKCLVIRAKLSIQPPGLHFSSHLIFHISTPARNLIHFIPHRSSDIFFRQFNLLLHTVSNLQVYHHFQLPKLLPSTSCFRVLSEDAYSRVFSMLSLSLPWICLHLLCFLFRYQFLLKKYIFSDIFLKKGL